MRGAVSHKRAIRFRKKLQRLVRRCYSRLRYPRLQTFRPSEVVAPATLLAETSAWEGIESILSSIISDFGLRPDRCLEFGVEFGYSTVALSNFFASVTGVDLFVGDEHTHHHGDHFEHTKTKLSRFANITLHQCDYRDWILRDNSTYDLIHVDIVHTFEDTFRCGLWSARHSTCTIFHDTESFPAVKRAMYNVSKATGKRAYNFPGSFGLGIVV